VKLKIPSNESGGDTPKRWAQWLGHRVFGIILLQHR
jgi:hypothetical protein